jgi:DNA polymerase-3 subunit epsilon
VVLATGGGGLVFADNVFPAGNTGEGAVAAYLAGAELVIHNAPFDVGFLNYELGLLGKEPVGSFCSNVVDTLRLAKELHPGKRNSLDALCERYEVDNSGRTLHGALLDSELLAEVYLAMTRGQETLAIDIGHDFAAALSSRGGARPKLFVVPATEEELAEHQQQLEDIDKASQGDCLWKSFSLSGEAAT